jgi:hypothetical protein
MSTCSTGCRIGSIACPRPWRCDDRPVEHPFGTLKAWMGATHFLTRTIDKVRTEMSLHVLAYNLKRMCFRAFLFSFGAPGEPTL